MKRAHSSPTDSLRYVRGLERSPLTLHQNQRKARELNPHDLAAARCSKPARQTVSGYLPKRVDPAGVEPALPARHADVFPLDHGPFISGDDGSRTHPGCVRSVLATSE